MSHQQPSTANTPPTISATKSTPQIRVAEIPDSTATSFASEYSAPSAPAPPSTKNGAGEEIPDSQEDVVSAGPSPKVIRRPSVEQLDPAEVARDIAKQLAEMKPYSVKPTQTIPRPPLQPFSGQTNPDATALRAAAGLLQMQKARAQQDLQTLERLKQSALENPEGFVNALKSGELRSGGGPKGQNRIIPDLMNDPPEDKPTMPAPQNVVRMPVINWAKYGIVGDSLDKMHEEQRTNPTPTEPERLDKRDQQPIPLDYSGHSGHKAPKHVLAAPYDPLAK